MNRCTRKTSSGTNRQLASTPSLSSMKIIIDERVIKRSAEKITLLCHVCESTVQARLAYGRRDSFMVPLCNLIVFLIRWTHDLGQSLRRYGDAG